MLAPARPVRRLGIACERLQSKVFYLHRNLETELLTIIIALIMLLKA